MKITIEKRSSTLGYDFLVYSEGKNIAYAVSEKIFGFLRISLWENETERKILKIRNLEFDTTLRSKCWVNYQGKKYQFITKSYNKRHFQFEINGILYDIYGHHPSWKYSVYANGIQIAWWDKRVERYEGPDTFEIEMNKDANVELLTAFCLILDDYIDILIEKLGELEPLILFENYGELIAFDREWQAK